MDVRRLQGYEAAQAIALTGADRRAMDSFQKVIIQILVEETSLLKKRNKVSAGRFQGIEQHQHHWNFVSSFIFYSYRLFDLPS